MNNNRYRLLPPQIETEFDETQFDRIKYLLEKEREDITNKYNLIKILDILINMKQNIDSKEEKVESYIIGLNTTYNAFIQLIRCFCPELLER